MKYFTNCATIEALKKEYRRLALANHPDRGGDVETMAAINAEYEKAFARLKDVHESTKEPGTTYKAEQATTETAAEFIEIINRLLKMPGLTIELCGIWLWISGDTYTNKDGLKAAGCKWSNNKKMWYWRHPDDHKVYGRHRAASIEQIRTRYGSQSFTTGTAEALPA